MIDEVLSSLLEASSPPTQQNHNGGSSVGVDFEPYWPLICRSVSLLCLGVGTDRAYGTHRIRIGTFNEFLRGQIEKNLGNS